jgi:hypothetical protein
VNSPDPPADGRIFIDRVANGFAVRPMDRGDFRDPRGTHVFTDAGALAEWVRRWAEGDDPKAKRDRELARLAAEFRAAKMVGDVLIDPYSSRRVEVKVEGATPDRPAPGSPYRSMERYAAATCKHLRSKTVANGAGRCEDCGTVFDDRYLA